MFLISSQGLVVVENNFCEFFQIFECIISEKEYFYFKY